MAFPDSFDTARLRAERLQPEHFGAIHAMHQDPVQMATLGGVRTAEQTAAYLERNLQHWDEHGFGVWVVRDRAGVIAGRAILRTFPIDGASEVEVGYSLAPAYWGQGLAPEIAKACLEYGHGALGFASIVAVTLPDNARSRRVLEKVGMHYEREVTHDGLAHVLYRTPATT